ncbi:MAG: adenylyl-sulfate kinase [Candidatus Parcubacteria bacterium]|jgi:adenylylsulfate kinase
MHESKWRSIVKGVTWRITASGTTMVVVYFMTGNLAIVAGVGLVDITLKIFFYYCHERVWGRVHWGILGSEPKRPTN